LLEIPVACVGHVIKDCGKETKLHWRRFFSSPAN
jgi:hypothetical protein